VGFFLFGSRYPVDGASMVNKNTIAYVLLAFGMVAGLYFGFTADTKLRHEISERCKFNNEFRLALHQEHLPKLADTREQMKRYPHGATITVNGKKLFFPPSKLVRDFYIEKHVVEASVPTKCP
jgi:hypothetical protein